MELSKRKHIRLKHYDYSLPGYYYVTIHLAQTDLRLSKVGRGLAPAEATVDLMPLGIIAQQQLLELQQRFPYMRIDKYVIMPTHIHAIIHLGEFAGESQRPSLTDIICAYKSLTTRQANRLFRTPGRKLFQASFYETVLRNETAYQKSWQYIENNPGKWLQNPED